ncbi:hypothetical protein M436DRAFT_84728 [Aureobasidium namibiae CBS 147.97]|uniref:Uncharacterized protein n=1 Tax=Aureobasidium namibiae CBS 147.97 TaxID=1043004 RepID=A0A074WK13_9PEZI
MSVAFHHRMRTQYISPTYNHHHYGFAIHAFGQFERNTTCIAPIELRIPNHEPTTYFDVITFTKDTYHIAVIAIIAINMSAPSREQCMAAPTPGRFVSDVNRIGPDGRILPAGAAFAAAAAAAAAEQEARRRADDQTFATAAAVSREVERENAGEKKSLLRRVGSKIASVFKRDQEKMN